MGTSRSEKPNILLIVMDTVRYDHLSCYGYHRPTTPHLEDLAAEGVLFEKAFAAAPWTPPSHASLFTGTYPSEHGVTGESLGLTPAIPTLAEVLSSAGYVTFGVSTSPHVSRARGFHKGFHHLVETWTMPRIKFHRDYLTSLGRNLILGRDQRAYHINRIVKKQLAKFVQEKTPFFLFVNYNNAHAAYNAPIPFKRRFGKKANGKVNWRNIGRLAGGHGGYSYMAGKLECTEEEFAIIRSWYDGEIAYLDHRIHEVLEFLQQCKIFDDTLIIITSDHGENFGEHHLAYHLFCLYDTLIHVPLLMRYPRAFPRGKKIATLVSLVDLFPTITQLLGYDMPAFSTDDMRGKSLFPLSAEKHHRFVFAEFGRPTYMLRRLAVRFPDHDFSPFDRGLQCIRGEDVKFIRDSDGREELYDIGKDPEEKVNLAKLIPEKAATLRDILRQWSSAVSGPALPREDASEDGLVRKALEDLGYF